MTEPLPVGFRIVLDTAARQLDDCTWFGGSPERVVRLTAAGGAALTELLAGPVASRNSAALARKLTDAGLAHPCPPPPADPPSVTVVIPVRDRADALRDCLAALGHRYRVVVADDGSRDPAAVAAAVHEHGATLVRRAASGGAGPARNTGAAHVDTDVVAFVDSDCTPTGDWIDSLLPHFADPLVGAVAPRVVGTTSALDQGEQPARVLPHARVAYVPTAALLVRRSALTAVGGFDETIGRGEDVDLVWRLHEAGWRVRYDPATVVRHHESTSWSALVERRFRYGKSAAPLAVRHPGAITPLVLHPWPTAVVLALLARRPLLAVLAYCGSVVAMVDALRRAGAPTDGVPRSMLSAAWQTLRGISRYSTQYAAPVLAVAALAPGSTWRRVVTGALLLGPALAAGDPLRGLTDDVVYGAGVWYGCLTTGTTAPVRPVLATRPLRVD